MLPSPKENVWSYCPGIGEEAMTLNDLARKREEKVCEGNNAIL